MPFDFIEEYKIYKYLFIYLFAVPSTDEIKKLVIANGGIFQHYYAVSKVTHIIASNLPTSKISQIRDKKVIRPDWIVNRLQNMFVAANSCLFLCSFFLDMIVLTCLLPSARECRQ